MESKQTFLVHIIENQNATWQGEITWLNEEKKECFRSLLEMIKLIDAALGSSDEEEQVKKINTAPG